MIYYVSTNGNDAALGTKEAPFKTINHAAQIAVAGDTVRVFGGTYRENVDPKNMPDALAGLEKVLTERAKSK